MRKNGSTSQIATGPDVDIAELERKLGPFVRHHYADPTATVGGVHAMPGHAGFSFGFDAHARGKLESWYIRVPPPNTQWRGTADVLRQVEVLNALDATSVPHCSVRWSGGRNDDERRWFGCPYFIVPKLTGDTVKLGPGEWATLLSREALLALGGEIMGALARVHRLDVGRVPYLGEPIPGVADVERWDRFVDRAGDPELMRLVPQTRQRLLATLPSSAPIGVFHGDFQPTNLFCAPEGRLLAIIDWELVGIGATLNDVGWMCTFADNEAWARDEVGGTRRPAFLDPETLTRLYAEAWGEPLPDIAWYRALACYKFAIITGLNLGLHRRGKRVDPSWEITARSIDPLLRRALQLLG